MNPLKLKRMKALAESLRSVDKSAAWDLISMIEAYEQGPCPHPEILRESVTGALHAVESLLSKYSWCLAGGLAVIHWVNIRPTYDVDCVVFSSDIEDIKKSLPNPKVANLGISSKIGGTDVDFLDSSLFPYAEDAIRSAIMQDYDGMRIPVMAPEYLVVFKLDSMRDKDNQDAFALLRIYGVPEKARKIVRKHKPSLIDDLEQAISIANLAI